MDGKGTKGKTAARDMASSLSAGSSSNKTSKGKTLTTTSLEAEVTKVAIIATAADAKAKAHQGKMTKFVQGGHGTMPQGGAGELGLGPSGPAVMVGAGHLKSGPSGPTAAHVAAAATTTIMGIADQGSQSSNKWQSQGHQSRCNSRFRRRCSWSWG